MDEAVLQSSLDYFSAQISTLLKSAAKLRKDYSDLENGCISGGEDYKFFTADASVKKDLAEALYQRQLEFISELKSELNKHGFAFAEKFEWKDIESRGSQQLLLSCGAFFLDIDFAADSMHIMLSGMADHFKTVSLKKVSSAAEAFAKWHKELVSKKVKPEEFVYRLKTAVSLAAGKSGRRSFSLSELYPYAVRFALMNSSFAKLPSRSNLAYYSKADFIYNLTLLIADKNKLLEKAGLLLEAEADSINMESIVCLTA